MNELKFDTKIKNRQSLFAIIFLKIDALVWIVPHLKNFQVFFQKSKKNDLILHFYSWCDSFLKSNFTGLVIYGKFLIKNMKHGCSWIKFFSSHLYRKLHTWHGKKQRIRRNLFISTKIHFRKNWWKNRSINQVTHLIFSYPKNFFIFSRST